MTLEDILRKFYRAEQNISISSFFDAGWELKIGDPANGYLEEGSFDTIEEVTAYLIDYYDKHLENAA